MSKDRDINVGSIEKDIENLEKYIELVIDKNYCDCNELNVICYGKYADGSKNVASSIKNILQDYTRQKQINKEHQKVNGELREKVKELEENSTLKNFTSSIFNNNIEKDFIVKQKIKDKIDELKETLKHYNEYSKLNLLEKVNVDLIDARIDILQELLQEEAKNEL